GRGVKLRMVEQIEEFRPEVEPHILPWQRKPLDYREIGVDEVRARQGSARSGSQFTYGRRSEGAGIKVEPRGFAQLIRGQATVGHQYLALRVRICGHYARREGVGDLIDTAGGESGSNICQAGSGIWSAVQKEYREPGCDFFDEGYLPPSEERVGHARPIAAELLALTEWQIIDDAGGKTIVQVYL